MIWLWNPLLPNPEIVGVLTEMRRNKGQTCRVWIVGSVYCTLQLHFPVWSAQAHTCLSRSQVWLSDPEMLHSHWVHCGKCGSRQRQVSVINSRAGREELAECVLALCFTKPINFQMKMLPSSHSHVSGNITEVQTNTELFGYFFPFDWSN